MNENLYLSLRQANKNSRFYYENGLDIEIPKYFKNLLDARYHKVSRVKERFIYLACRRIYVFFLTFTFDEEYIDKCDRTKKDLIKNCLNGIEDSLYIMNIDFGDKTDREHYHVILGTDFPLSKVYFQLSYPCFTWIENIPLDKINVNKVSKYIDKLSNHAGKDSTQYHRIYYNFKGYNSIKDKGYRNFLKYLDIKRLYKGVSVLPVHRTDTSGN